eukprot:TRINITY_DN81_c1_g1_i1.p1 TRINITY_DN81_c1_g1~~TRINITY_DN81_c1_g1_i1.p1  ORF type:complete len:317 (-),score=143.89 TRINITY_DN81_c1_g1_i1:122-1018(-)
MKYYDIQEEIGCGAFSVVRVATHRESGEKFAIKIIRKKDIGADLNRLQTEIEILKQVQHPNIIYLKDIFETPEIVAIVMELVTGGELFDRIVEQGSYSEKDASVLVSKMVSAIEYLHARGIVHRDLKPENLLLKCTNNLTEVKIADFGLSKIVGTDSISRMLTACGTPSYVAPEVLLTTGYDKEVDLWSIGVITYILLCGFPPFYDECLNNLFEEIMEARYEFPEEYWGHISEEAKDFVARLLLVNPEQRMTASQALEHPWIVNGGKSKPTASFNAKFKENLKKSVDKRRSTSSIRSM